MFVKKDYPVFPPTCPDNFREEVRKEIPSVNGGFDVFFEEVDSSELCKEVLDPRLVTLESCINNNVFIDPSLVRGMLNATDVADIEELSGRVSEEAFEYIVKNGSYDVEKNTLVKESSVESKSK